MISFCDTGLQEGIHTPHPLTGDVYGEKKSLFLERGKMPGNYPGMGRMHS